MKMLSFITLTAMLSLTACSHHHMKPCCKEKATCTTTDCKKACCDKDKKCSDGSCGKTEQKADCAGENCKKKS